MNRTKSECKRESNPVLKANLISKFTFWWLRKLFYKGYSRPLEEDEIYENKPWLDCQKNCSKFEILWNEELKSKNPSILRVIFRSYGLRLILLGLLQCIADTGARLFQPLCLGALVSYFVAGQTEISKESAYIYAGGIVLGSLIPVITFHPYILYILQIGTKIRVSCAALIYSKILRISKASSNDGLSGRAINILSNDLGKIDMALCFVHDLWKGPLEAVLLGYFMYMEIGISAVIGVAFMLGFIPLQAWGAKKAAYYRQRTAERTDLRVKLMNEIIQGIQVIKMYAWEGSFAKVIADARRKEINAIRGTAYIHAGLYTTTMISRFSIFLSLVSYVFLGDIVTAKKVFVVSSFFNMLNDSMVHFWPLAIAFCAEAYVSVRRVKQFLLEKEGKDHPVEIARKMSKEEMNGDIKHNGNGVAKSLEAGLGKKVKVIGKRRTLNLIAETKGITMSDATAAWDSSMGEKSNDVIKNFNIEIKDSSLVVVVGPVGSGKTSLLNVIIGELELDHGYVTVNGTPSYACQEPWVFEGTIKDNIVFIDEFDEKHYNEVVRVCALERDFELFANGDQTLVGERGISLSGGQKARVSLARAIYRKADIYLLDDPLSAVDAQVGRHIFEKCIQEFLKEKICVLVTHQLQYLKDIEHVIFINNGTIAAQGNYNDLYKLPELKYLAQTHDESGEAEDMGKCDKEFQKITQPKLKKTTEDDSEERKETQAVGSVGLNVYKSYFKSLNGYTYLFIVLCLFLAARATLSAVDYFISRWAIWEEDVSSSSQTLPELVASSSLNKSESVIGELFSAGPDYSNVTRTQSPEIQAERENLIVIYSILLGSAIILYLTRTFGFFMMCLRISLNLHDKLFRGITRAKMRFFNTNSSGRILNRFSRDMHTIDTSMPDSMLDCLTFVTDVTAVLLMVVVVNFWLLIPAAVVAIISYLMRTFYVNTSRSVKRIESMSRSPIYSHTNQTFQGLTTIRAFGAEQVLINEFHSYQNSNSAAWYTYLAITRAFAFWLDIVCVIFIGAVTFSFMLLEDQFQSGDVGLAIMQSITMIGMCQWGMRQTAELENQMTSVERIIEYAQQPSEGELETTTDQKPLHDWPDKGEVKFEKLSLRYSDNSDPILKKLDLEIEPMEKIGIVGRTGAGKSSIIQAIFRLALNDGSIVIDGNDIGTLGLHDLRSKISIIPQDPILFSGTLRYNLDPFETKSDGELWKALEDVQLKTHVSSLIGGLNCKMSDGGSNFSMGQRQLVCLARAILRNNKILILDEATANVDPETDKLIQLTIRTKFAKCTVLTIAHRLHTVMDSDRVLVMDAGQAVEFDHPFELLQKPDGHLRNLVNKTGVATAAILLEAAKSSYKSNSSTVNENNLQNRNDK